MLVIPGALIGLITLLHLYLVIRLGVTSPPWSDVAAGRDRDEQPTAAGGRSGLLRPGGRRRPEWLAAGSRNGRTTSATRRTSIARGNSSRAMFHDTVMSLVVVSVIVYFRLCLVLHGRGVGRSRAARAALHRGSRSGTTDFIPRPDWFFYFLFYLLRIFKWPDTVVLGGTVGVPNASSSPILVALPFVICAASIGCCSGPWQSWPRSSSCWRWAR